MGVDKNKLRTLALEAWRCRARARVLTGVRVGAALVTHSGKLFSGCNIEHQFRCHDLHAEVSAIAGMVCSGEQSIRGIVIAAKTERFTPCGGCMDWIMEFGGAECVVAFQPKEDGGLYTVTAGELMPHYPRLGT